MRTLFSITSLALALLITGCEDSNAPAKPYSDEGVKIEGVSFSRGKADTTVRSLIECGGNSRISAVGTITAEDGTEWVVPAQTEYKNALKASDMYNDCGMKVIGGADNFDLSTVPVIDAGGDEEFIAYIFADNYFELYVNGKLIVVDSVPFTPFNSSVVRFKADRPVTLAFKLVDWEENLGLGSESGRGNAYQPGDGGLVVHIQSPDGETIAITDESWKAQTFYVSPLQNRSCLKIVGNLRDTSQCKTDGVSDGTSFSAAFWPIPEGWEHPNFEDKNWPSAYTYSNKTVGVDNKRAYTDFEYLFDDPNADAQFIWSSNLILDNIVLVRKEID